MQMKTFDCVEMKNQIQRQLFNEYQNRKNEFSSYVEFINATSDQDPNIQAFRGKQTNADLKKGR